MGNRKLKRELVEKWLKTNRRFLKIKCIERETNLKENTIQRFVKNDSRLTTIKITRIFKWLMKLPDMAEEDLIIKTNKCFNISAVERGINVKRGMIQKHIKYGRKIYPRTFELIEKWQLELLKPIKKWEQNQTVYKN
jgi:hypothetical protein